MSLLFEENVVFVTVCVVTTLILFSCQKNPVNLLTEELWVIKKEHVDALPHAYQLKARGDFDCETELIVLVPPNMTKRTSLKLEGKVDTTVGGDYYTDSIAVRINGAHCASDESIVTCEILCMRPPPWWLQILADK